MKRPFLSELLNFLFPPLCHLCHSCIADPGDIHLCPQCLATFTPLAKPFCTLCGLPFAGAGDNHLCGSCCVDTPMFDSARAPFVYGGGVQKLLHAFKYTPKPHLRKPLALLTAEFFTSYMTNIQADMIIPVPLHKRRLRQRGFNQAVLLGDVLARQWQIPMNRSLLQRIRWTEPQVSLSAVERHANVKGAFAVKNEKFLDGKCVLLLDDVFTTGCTLNECAKVLKLSGVSRVSCVTVARAI